jgi:hypothetical protein
LIQGGVVHLSAPITYGVSAVRGASTCPEGLSVPSLAERNSASGAFGLPARRRASVSAVRPPLRATAVGRPARPEATEERCWNADMWCRLSTVSAIFCEF